MSKPPYKELEKNIRHLKKKLKELEFQQNEEVTLEKSEKVFESIIQSVPDIIYRLDQDGKIIFINDSIAKYGYIVEELIGKSIIDLIHPEDRDKAKFRINERRTGDRRSRSFELRLINKHGETTSHNKIQVKDYKLAPVFLFEAEGLYSSEKPETKNFLGTQGIAKEITGLKQAEKALRELESQLLRAQKMESIGTLAASIAHDFNNILGAILLNTELALKYTPKDHKSCQMLEDVIDSTNRAKHLVEQILTFSRQEEPEKKLLKLEPVIKEIIKFLQTTLPSTISITLTVNTENDFIIGNINQIHSIMVNLCNNSSYAMKEHGGKIEVSLDEVDFDKNTANSHPDLKPGPYVKLTIRDTGFGIDKTILERVFEPFFTTKEIGKGTGLGLSVVYGIVKSYDGAITIQSEPGTGTTINVFFHRVEEVISGEDKII